MHRCSGYNNIWDETLKGDLSRGLMQYGEAAIFLEPDIVVTHAGLTKQVWNALELDLEDIEGDAEHLFESNNATWHGIGRSRGGIKPYGGAYWCDWYDDFEPVEGVRQVTGHTALTAEQLRIGGPKNFKETSPERSWLRQSPNGDWNIDCLDRGEEFLHYKDGDLFPFVGD